jgi:deoxyribonucleoside regulator
MDDIRLLTKIATLYYEGGLNQQEIGERLGISRQTASRHIKRAQDLGIVKIQIQSTPEYSPELEFQLETVFHLDEVIVVTPPADTEEAVKETLGKAAAAFMQRRVLPNDVIGVAWSSTVLQCAIQLQRKESRKVTVVQLNGSMDRSSYSTRAEYIIEQIAYAFDGTTASLVAPMFVDHASIKQSLLSDSRTAATLDLATASNLALFGVGNVSEQSNLYKTGYMDDTLLELLRGVGAVGEICGRFYNDQGNICMEELNERTIAVELDNLKTKRVSASIAAGIDKVDAILGMLAGKYCNVLITSDDTAKELLSRKGTQ